MQWDTCYEARGKNKGGVGTGVQEAGDSKASEALPGRGKHSSYMRTSKAVETMTGQMMGGKRQKGLRTEDECRLTVSH